MKKFFGAFLMAAVFFATALFNCAVCAKAENTTNEKSEIKIQKPKLAADFEKMSQEKLVKYTEIFVKLPSARKRELIEYYLENPKVPPILYTVAADAMSEKDKEKGLRLYLIGRIRSTQDVLTCTDKSNMQQIYAYPLLAPNTIKYMGSHKKIYAKLTREIIEWDKKADRLEPGWACYHGLGTGTVEADKFDEIREQFRQDVLDSLKKRGW